MVENTTILHFVLSTRSPNTPPLPSHSSTYLLSSSAGCVSTTYALKNIFLTFIKGSVNRLRVIFVWFSRSLCLFTMMILIWNSNTFKHFWQLKKTKNKNAVVRWWISSLAMLPHSSWHKNSSLDDIGRVSSCSMREAVSMTTPSRSQGGLIIVH